MEKYVDLYVLMNWKSRQYFKCVENNNLVDTSNIKEAQTFEDYDNAHEQAVRYGIYEAVFCKTVKG